MQARKPWREGVSNSGKMVDPDARLPKIAMKLGKGTLSSLTAEFAFFTPALLYINDAFETDGPLFDFLAEYRQPVEFYHHKFQRRLFRGMTLPDGDADWEYVLWAVPKIHEPALTDFFCSLCFIDNVKKKLMRIGVNTLIIDDPLALQSGVLLTNVLPTVEIRAFGISGNQGCIAVMPGNGPFSLPTVRRFPPEPKVVEYARRVFKEEDIPCG